MSLPVAQESFHIELSRDQDERNSEIASLFDKQHFESKPQAKENQTVNVLAASALFAQTVSDLSNLEGQHIPDARKLAALVSLQPRITRALAVQQIQSRQANELQIRSAQLLTRWYQHSVIEEGEHWAGWEDRMLRIEMQVRRRENAQRMEE